MNKGRTTLGSKLKLFPTLVFCLLAFSLYFPQLFAPSPLIGTRALLTSILVSLTFAAIVFFKNVGINSISLYVMTLATIFPIYLTFIGIAQGGLGLTFFGNSDRSLGVITYLTCSGFFLFGVLLRKFYNDALIRIIIGLGIFQIIVLSTRYFGLSSDSRQGSFYNSNPNSLLTGLISVFILTWIMESKFKYRLQIACTLCAFSVALLFWIGALQAIIGYLITIFIISITRIQRRSTVPLKYYLTLVASVGIIFFIFIGVSKSPTQQESVRDSFNERLDIYKTSIRVISDNFFFGLGVDQFNLGYYALNQSGNIKLVDNAHSIPLQLFSTTGIFGLIIFYTLFFLVIKQSYSMSNSTMSPIRNSIFFYLISGFFAIQTPSLEGIVFLMLGYLVNKDQIRMKGKFRDNSVRVRLGSIGLVGAISLSYFAIPFLQTSQALGENFKNSSESNLLIRQNIDKVYDLGLLFNAGQYSIAIGDKQLGSVVLGRMMKISDIDQRTIALTLLIAREYKDTNLEKIGTQLNDLARS